MTTTYADIRPIPRCAWISLGRRLRDKQTQEQLAEALTTDTGRAWTRGMVAALENGKKHFTVDTLVAVARIQDLPVEFYLRISDETGDPDDAPIIHGLSTAA